MAVSKKAKSTKLCAIRKGRMVVWLMPGDQLKIGNAVSTKPFPPPLLNEKVKTKGEARAIRKALNRLGRVDLVLATIPPATPPQHAE